MVQIQIFTNVGEGGAYAIFDLDSLENFKVNKRVISIFSEGCMYLYPLENIVELRIIPDEDPLGDTLYLAKNVSEVKDYFTKQDS